MFQLLDSSPFFSALMSAIPEEAYLIDASSMQVLEASDSAFNNMGGDLIGLQLYSLQALLGMDEQALTDYVNSHQHQTQFVEILDKAEYSDLYEIRVLLIHANDKQYILAIKNDVSFKKQAIQALVESESRFQALVANTPGLFFQFQLDAKNEISFVYLSDGCKALFGVEAEELKQSPQQFFTMINVNDRALLLEGMQASAVDLKMLNWEGRFWIDEWKDIKWVNLRSIPRKLANGAIQWEGIMTNISQSKNEKHALEQSRKRLAELSAHLTQVKEQERSSIAREIHDDLGGNLTAIKIGLASIIKLMKADQQILIEKTKNLESIVDNTFEAVHRISSDLRPDILELGIVAALEWQAQEFETQIGIKCHFISRPAELSVTKDQAITLFRICQEAMSNIAKHAYARQVDLELSAEPDGIRMHIHDDGVGISPSDMLKPNSFGLRGMAERVRALNGSFAIEKSNGKGTSITITLPYYAGLASDTE